MTDVDRRASRTSSRPTRSAAPAGPRRPTWIEVDDGPARGRAGHGPARAAAQELHPARRTSRPRDADRGRLRLGRLRGHARQAARARRPRRVPREQAERCASRASTAASDSPPTPRSAGSRRRGSSGPQGVGAPGRRLGVGDGPRPHHRRGRPSTPAPRRTARATRPASPRSSPTGSGSIPQQVEVIHGDTDTGPEGRDTYGSRSLAVGGEAVARAADKVAAEGQGDRRRTSSRPRRRTSRCADGKFSVRGLARQGHDPGRDRGRRVHRAGLPDGHGAGARGDDVLRPGELRVPVRRARLRGRRRPRDGQGQGRPLRRGRRLRPGDQPDADRRPGPRRDRARASARRCTSGSTTTRTGSS